MGFRYKNKRLTYCTKVKNVKKLSGNTNYVKITNKVVNDLKRKKL